MDRFRAGTPYEAESESAPDRIRTCDLRFRRPTLYPTELRARNGTLSQAADCKRRGPPRANRSGPRAAAPRLQDARASLRWFGAMAEASAVTAISVENLWEPRTARG